ncbi:MAG: hypothetical protein JWO32_535 [Bacteroidetes bacterium]|nr:hypothetical protein [Bacteroidota bacterium]
MDSKDALRQQTLTAEKQISIVRMLVIIFGTATFFFIENAFIQKKLAHFLLVLIWIYGLYVPIFKPYEKFPIFTASWFTSITDCIFAILWIYATGGYFSPYHVMFYTSIIAVSFRFNLKTTLITSALYTITYFALLIYMNQLTGNENFAAVRMGFIFIIGFMTHLITSETLFQTQQKLSMKKLMEEAKYHHDLLKQNQTELYSLNNELRLKNNIFNHAEENAHIGSYSWNLKTNELKYSDNLYRLLGCQPNEFTPSFETYMSFVHPDDKPDLLKTWAEAKKNNIMHPNFQRIFTKQGKIKYLKTTGKMTGEGDNILVIGTLQDVTTDIELNEALQQKNMELERSNNELASFNYIASHDLQEPVRKISTFSKLIIEKDGEVLSEASHGYMSRISASSIRMQNLIDAFLNYSKNDNTKLVFEQIDLNLIIDDVIESLSDMIAEKKVTITKAELPVLPGVKFQLQQLFVNLISNAIKYSRKNVDPIITINIKKIKGSEIPNHDMNPKGSYWELTIQDNGIGFEQKYSEKIFEVFQRLHNKDEYAGTGIGLSICKKIVRSHNGCIMASGDPGKGSLFSIYLPVSKF